MFLLIQTIKKYSSVFSTYSPTLTFPYLQQRWEKNGMVSTKVTVMTFGEVVLDEQAISKINQIILENGLILMSWPSYIEKSKCAAVWRTTQILGSKHAQNKYAKNYLLCLTK